MFAFIAAILTAFFEDCEVEPSTITEIEFWQGPQPNQYALHVQPARSWFAFAWYIRGKWYVSQHEYL